ncbi:MAG: hypothetical protein JXA14_15815 [Anaerolineae bacterium]|nr:hypothetical protein [Anaerolineae bacterium]
MSEREEQTHPRIWQGRFISLAVFALYVVLTIMMTWPLAAQLSTHAAGSGNDMWIYHWGNWWARKVLTEGGKLYWTSYMFYPQGVSLTWYAFSWLNTAIWLPLQALIGALAAYNITVLLAYLLSAYTAYLLARELTGSYLAAFIAGLVFAFYPVHNAYCNHLSFLSFQWMPLCALYLIRIGRRGRLRDGFGAGVSFAMCALSGERLLLLTVLWAALWLIYGLVFERHVWNRKTVKALLLAVVTCVLIAGPLLAPLVMGFFDPETSQDLTASTPGEKRTDLLAYFVPSRYHPLLSQKTVFKKLYRRLIHFGGHSTAIGYGASALIGWAVWRRWREARPWVFTALIPVLLALGSTLQVNGRELIPLPYKLLTYTPLSAAVRNPERFNIIVTLPVSALVGIGVSDLLDRLRARPAAQGALAVGISLVVLFEYLAVPFPMTRPIQSAFYEQLREEPGEFAVVDFPIGFHSHNKWYVYAQTLHGRPIVEGNVARVPAGAHSFIESVPVLSVARSSTPEEGALDDVTRQLNPLAEVGVRYVLIHKYRAGADETLRWREWFAFQPYYEDEYLLVFRTAPRYGEDFQFTTELGDGIGVMDTGVSTREVVQGGSVDVKAVWGSEDAPRQDWMVCLALVDSTGQEVQREDFELFPGRPTSEWGQSAVVRARWTLRVDPYIPAGGTYAMKLSLVNPETGERLGEPIELGRLDVQAIERAFEMPEVETESEAVFGEELRLLGYDMRRESDRVKITLHWQALRRMDVAYKFFMHVVDPESGRLIAQTDVMPYGWTYPTFWWEAGEVVSDEITLSLADVPRGTYRLEIGVYDPDSGERLPLTDGRGSNQPADRFFLSEMMEVTE